MNNQIIQTTALGRPFRLGMLYDRRTDTILPGETLFSRAEISEHASTENLQGADSEVILGSSFEKKSCLFEADANLKLNFMKGSVNLGSSGKYLTNNSSSKNKVEVCLSTNIYTSYTELDIRDLFKKNREPQNISNSSATHIVCAMKCGAHVNLNFERTITSDENKQKIEGEMKGALDALLSMGIDGSISGRSHSSDERNTEKMSCKFYGDLIPKQNPTTYEEAVSFFKTLPTMLTDASAPVTVWLYPLSLTNGKESYIERQIDGDALKQVLAIYDRLSKLTMASSELLRHPSCTFIPEIQSKLQAFADRVQSTGNNCRNNMDSMLADKIETARKCIELTEQENWLAMAQFELGLFDFYISVLKESEIIPSDPLDFERKIFENDNVVHVSFSLPLLNFNADTKENKEPEKRSTDIIQSSLQLLSGTRQNEQTRSIVTWSSDFEIKSLLRKTIKGIKDIKSKNKKIVLIITFHDVEMKSPKEFINVSYLRNGEEVDVEFNILDKGKEGSLPLFDDEIQKDESHDLSESDVSDSGNEKVQT